MMHSMMMRNYFHPRRVPARVPDSGHGDLKMIASMITVHDASDPGIFNIYCMYAQAWEELMFWSIPSRWSNSSPISVNY